MTSPPVLPKDVVREMFALFAGTTLATKSPAEYPWFLGHICSTWRSVFLSMSEVWSSISISFGMEGNERQKNIIRFFLERDPTAPFSLDVEFSNVANSEREEEHILHALEMLVTASNRWKDALFKARMARFLLPLRRIQNRLPLLQRFKLVLGCYGYGAEIDPFFDVLQHTPSLTAIDVQELPGWNLNLTNLKTITIHEWDSSTSNFVAALPKLEQLIIHEHVQFPYHIILPNIILPNLIKLDCAPDLLSLLEAPSLRDLSINRQPYRESSSNADVVQSFLSRSSCTMNILSLSIKDTRAAIAIEIIKLTPQIVHLKLVSVEGIEDVFEQLIISTKPAQEWLACHMQSLTVHYYHDDTSDDLLFDLVSSRTDSAADARLQKLVQSRTRFDLNPPRLIALCKERGVSMEMLTPHGIEDEEHEIEDEED